MLSAVERQVSLCITSDAVGIEGVTVVAAVDASELITDDQGWTNSPEKPGDLPQSFPPHATSLEQQFSFDPSRGRHYLHLDSQNPQLGIEATFIQGLVGGGGYRAGDPDTNYDGLPQLWLEEDVNADMRTAALLRFSGMIGDALGQIPAGAVITGATLELGTSDYGYADSPGTVSLHATLMSWDEATVTWNGLLAGFNELTPETHFSLDEAGSFIPDAAATNYQVELSGHVQAQVNGEIDGGLILFMPHSNAAELVSDDPEEAERDRAPRLLISWELAPAG